MDDCGYLWRSKGMILDCPQTWNWNRTMLNINRPVHRNQTHSLKILSVSFTTLNTKSIFLAKPGGSKYFGRSWEVFLPKVSSSSPVIVSSDRWFRRHKPSWCPPLAFLFVLELLPLQTTIITTWVIVRETWTLSACFPNTLSWKQPCLGLPLPEPCIGIKWMKIQTLFKHHLISGLFLQSVGASLPPCPASFNFIVKLLKL